VAVGSAQGHQEPRTTLAGLIADFEFIQGDRISTVIDGERAVVHSRVKLQFIPKDGTLPELSMRRFADLTRLRRR